MRLGFSDTGVQCCERPSRLSRVTQVLCVFICVHVSVCHFPEISSLIPDCLQVWGHCCCVGPSMGDKLGTVHGHLPSPGGFLVWVLFSPPFRPAQAPPSRSCHTAGQQWAWEESSDGFTLTGPSRPYRSGCRGLAVEPSVSCVTSGAVLFFVKCKGSTTTPRSFRADCSVTHSSEDI